MQSQTKQVGLAVLIFMLILAGFALGTRLYTIPSRIQNPALYRNSPETAQDECGKGIPFPQEIHYQAANSAVVGEPKVKANAALEIAAKNAYVRSQLPAPAMNIEYVSFSDDVIGKATKGSRENDAAKHLLYQNVPAWIVTFCGVQVMPVSGPAMADPKKSPPLKPVASEWNVVIDAMTGEAFEQFASQAK